MLNIQKILNILITKKCRGNIMKKVMLIFGTRPEAIKMAPVIIELKKRNLAKCIVCVSGQHKELLYDVLENFEIVPDEDFSVMKENQCLTELTSRMLVLSKNAIIKYNPDIVLVHGDTATALSASMAAFYLDKPVAHIEAGLRTGDFKSPFPEEFNRFFIDKVSSLLFAPTKKTFDNLIKEGIDEKKVFITGNTVIDSLFFMIKKINHKDVIGSNTKTILVTGHRRESFGKKFENICYALRDIANKNSDVHIIYPVHLNPNVQEPVNRILKDIENISLIAPQNYKDFISLMNSSYLILTDSGGIQEEAPSLKIPTLVMRDKTERQEGVDANLLKLVGTNKEDIVREVENLIKNKDAYESMRQNSSPYGDGFASAKIVSQVYHYLDII